MSVALCNRRRLVDFRYAPVANDGARWCNMSRRAKPGRRPAPSTSSSRQRGEKRLRFRDLGKFRGRRKALERGREQGVGVLRTARGVIKSSQIESCAQLETARLLLLRDGDCSKECFLGRRRVRRIALQQDLATDAVQVGVGPMLSRLLREHLASSMG